VRGERKMARIRFFFFVLVGLIPIQNFAGEWKEFQAGDSKKHAGINHRVKST
jgi:hypothetical protein